MLEVYSLQVYRLGAYSLRRCGLGGQSGKPQTVWNASVHLGCYSLAVCSLGHYRLRGCGLTGYSLGSYTMRVLEGCNLGPPDLEL